MSEIPLSIVILAKNEEERISGCIKSVKEWAGEVIVIDDESTDNTCRLAEELGAKVLVRRMDIEGRHRNWAYSQAGNEWVLSLDADERLTEELKKEIEKVLTVNSKGNAFTPLEVPGLKKGKTKLLTKVYPVRSIKLKVGKQKLLTGFTIPRRNFIGDYWMRWGGQYPSAQLKLFRKDKFKWEEAEVHPRAFLDGECGHLKGDLIHYTYKDWASFLRKLNNQTTLEAKKWHKLSLTNPKKAGHKMSLFHALWRTFDRFVRAFIGKKGYRDGFIGFMSAYFGALYQIVSYAKYRDLKKNDK